MVLERGSSAYVVGMASVVRSHEDVSADLAAAVKSDWSIEKSNPMITWISGDFVESDKPNENKQFWTAGDLEIAEYSILHAPLNMVHKFRTPVGFFADTKIVRTAQAAVETAGLNDIEIALAEADLAAARVAKPLKISALSGMWSHIFPFETVQVEAANEAGLLFYSMECRGTHITCAGPNGCGKTFEYAKVKTHCEHLMERASVRHIVNPTFRGGALIVPPVRPGWKHADAKIVSEAVMQEAASFAEQNEDQYKVLNANGADLTASAWETLMGQILQAGQ